MKFGNKLSNLHFQIMTESTSIHVTFKRSDMENFKK